LHIAAHGLQRIPAGPGLARWMAVVNLPAMVDGANGTQAK
jgi:hypothetical protein